MKSAFGDKVIRQKGWRMGVKKGGHPPGGFSWRMNWRMLADEGSFEVVFLGKSIRQKVGGWLADEIGDPPIRQSATPFRVADAGGRRLAVTERGSQV